jgi:hypothetical protein
LAPHKRPHIFFVREKEKEIERERERRRRELTR